MKWSHPISLKELSVSVNYGFTASATDEKLGPKFLRITDIVPDQISWDNVPYCEIDESKLDRFSLQRDDIVVARTGATVGYAKLIRDAPSSVFASYLVRIRIDPNKAFPGYVGRIVESKVFKKYVWSRIGGAAQPNANARVLSGFKLRLPDHKTQIRIADILSAYDDLIVNNCRRIELLEQAARLLYKEWFVHLRFPGHEHTTIKDGVPEGWVRRPLKDITTKIGSGATPRGGAASYKTEGITLIRSQHVYDYRFDEDGLAFIDDEQAERLDNVIVEPRDILLNITGASVARCCMVPGRFLPARVNQHVMIIRIDPNECSPHYILGIINSHREKQQLLSIARAGGATREALTKDTICNMAYAIPPKPLLTEFDAVAEELFNQQECLSQQNEKLANARDLLLPRLMNGEIAV